MIGFQIVHIWKQNNMTRFKNISVKIVKNNLICEKIIINSYQNYWFKCWNMGVNLNIEEIYFVRNRNIEHLNLLKNVICSKNNYSIVVGIFPNMLVLVLFCTIFAAKLMSAYLFIFTLFFVSFTRRFQKINI